MISLHLSKGKGCLRDIAYCTAPPESTTAHISSNKRGNLRDLHSATTKAIPHAQTVSCMYLDISSQEAMSHKCSLPSGTRRGIPEILLRHGAGELFLYTVLPVTLLPGHGARGRPLSEKKFQTSSTRTIAIAIFHIRLTWVKELRSKCVEVCGTRHYQKQMQRNEKLLHINESESNEMHKKNLFVPK